MQLIDDFQLGTGGLVTALGRFLDSFAAALDRRQIGKRQFDLNRLDISPRINRTVHVHDGFVFKAAHYLNHRVGFADRVQELIAQAFALRRTANQAGDVHELYAGGHYFFRLDELCQRRQTFIRNGDDSDIWFTGRKSVIGDQRRGLPGHRIKERRLSDIW